MTELNAKELDLLVTDWAVTATEANSQDTKESGLIQWSEILSANE